MPPLVRNLALTAAVALVAGFIGAQVSLRYFSTPEAAAEPFLRQTVFTVVFQNMSLTPDQRSQISAIEDRYLEQRARVRSRISTANGELARAMIEDMDYGPKTEAATQEIQTAFGELQRDAVMYSLSVRAVLTPDQQREFDQKITSVL